MNNMDEKNCYNKCGSKKNISKAYKKIEEDSKYKSLYNSKVFYISGPTGPTGPSETITVGNTLTGDPGSEAIITDTKIENNHILEFTIPRGTPGASVKILGAYDTYEELLKEHPVGNIGDGYLIDGNLYVWTENDNKWNNVGNIKGPKGDKGDFGLIKSTYLVTFNSTKTFDGIKVNSNERIPIERVELDIGSLITFDKNNNLIRFNIPGFYKISFTVSAYPAVKSIDFDPETDIVSVGFKLKDTDNAYVGVGQWVYNGEPVELYAQGIIVVNNTTDSYELVNLGKSAIYLQSPSIDNIASKSYFSNSLVTILIEYLGK